MVAPGQTKTIGQWQGSGANRVFVPAKGVSSSYAQHVSSGANAGPSGGPAQQQPSGPATNAQYTTINNKRYSIQNGVMTEIHTMYLPEDSPGGTKPFVPYEAPRRLRMSEGNPLTPREAMMARAGIDKYATRVAFDQMMEKRQAGLFSNTLNQKKVGSESGGIYTPINENYEGMVPITSEELTRIGEAGKEGGTLTQEQYNQKVAEGKIITPEEAAIYSYHKSYYPTMGGPETVYSYGPAENTGLFGQSLLALGTKRSYVW